MLARTLPAAPPTTDFPVRSHGSSGAHTLVSVKHQDSPRPAFRSWFQRSGVMDDTDAARYPLAPFSPRGRPRDGRHPAGAALPRRRRHVVRARPLQAKKRAPLLSAADRHLVSRFSYGVTPALAKQVRAAGGARKWFEKQLAGGPASDPGTTGLRDWWAPGLSYTGNAGAAALWDRQKREVEGGWEVMANYARWALARRIRSNRQVLEIMCEFWENHFNVPVNGDAAFTWRTDYGMVIRANALGSFAGLLRAAILHPVDGDLPQQRGQHEVRAQREPRARAARAAHGRPHRRLHRGRRQELRPHPHRLPGRDVAGLLLRPTGPRTTGPAR